MISKLFVNIIEEPSFPHFEYNNWGINVSQIHNVFGHLIATKNLYYFVTENIVLTTTASIAYIPSGSDIVNITDYYIFLLGDSVQYSKWNQGSTFYSLAWTDLTTIQSTTEKFHTFYLSQNYPNPFNPTTNIQYAVSSTQFVSLKVYDVLGNEIATLVNEEIDAGNYQVEWNASNLPSGIYFYRIRAGTFIETKKSIFLK